MTDQDIEARRKRDLERYYRRTEARRAQGALQQMRQAPADATPHLFEFKRLARLYTVIPCAAGRSRTLSVQSVFQFALHGVR